MSEEKIVPAPMKVSLALEKKDRVALDEAFGGFKIRNLGTVSKRSPTGYIHVEWDDHSEGWFSPTKAAELLRKAEGDDALPRHVWIFDAPGRDSSLWDGPLPTLDEPVCAVCREKQTDDNEFGSCKKAERHERK
jgi:hypothetical protein